MKKGIFPFKQKKGMAAIMEKESVILTKEGYEKLEEELNYLKSVKRNEISERIKVAREFGDLSENSEYEAAREEQANMESRILYIEEQLKNAHIMDSKTVSTKVVSVGTKVRIYDYDLEEEMEYSIVGKTESDPDQNKISDQSPLGIALLGNKKGAKVTVDAPGGSFICEIKEIKLAD